MNKILQLIQKEEERQRSTLMMIPSENYTYPEVRKAVGSVLMHKYAEGYPKKRYYQGNEVVDEVENLCKERALGLFNLDPEEWGVNVQPYSGTPANLAVMNAVLEPGDAILSMYLYDGGHLSHGWSYKGRKITLSSKIYNINFYYVDPKTGEFDYEKIEKQAKEVKPKLIISGGTAYAPEVDHEKLAEIAHKTGALYLADVSHEAGLIAGGANKSPFACADIVMMTTHKTLRGPRGAIVFARRNYKLQITNDKLETKDLSTLIDASVFPGLQGGPHMHTIAGIAVALEKAKSDEFKRYARQVVANAKELALKLKDLGFEVVSGGTAKHLVLLDLRNMEVGGWFAAWALSAAGIITNRSTVPGDTASPYYPSGLRLGTPAVTARGLKEREMSQIAQWIGEVINHLEKISLPEDSAKRNETLKEFKEKIKQDEFLANIKSQVENLCARFPVDLS